MSLSELNAELYSELSKNIPRISSEFLIYLETTQYNKDFLEKVRNLKEALDIEYDNWKNPNDRFKSIIGQRFQGELTAKKALNNRYERIYRLVREIKEFEQIFKYEMGSTVKSIKSNLKFIYAE